MRHMAFQEMEASKELTGVASLLAMDCLCSEGGAAIEAFSSLIDLAIDRPELLMSLQQLFTHHPALLADFLVHPKTTALACLLIAQWRADIDQRQRKISDMRCRETKLGAFNDAIAILRYRQTSEGSNFEEIADFLLWLQSLSWASPTEKTNDGAMMVSTARQNIAGWRSEHSLGVCQTLIRRLVEAPGDMAAVIAATELLASRAETVGLEATPIVIRYLELVTASGYDLCLNSLQQDGAVQLCELALHADETLREVFLSVYKIDPSRSPEDEGNPYTARDEVANSIRAHFRVLCRAVAGYRSLPKTILDATILTAQTLVAPGSGSLALAALSPRHDGHGASPPRDVPIAFDAAEALSVLSAVDGGRLVTAILGSDEPTFLAQLMRRAPAIYRERIRTRLGELTPESVSAADVFH